MNLKSATLIAIIGIAIQIVLYILLNMRILDWSSNYNLFALFIGQGSLLLFLVILYSKQK